MPTGFPGYPKIQQAVRELFSDFRNGDQRQLELPTALTHFKCNFTKLIASRIMLPKMYFSIRRIYCEAKNEFPS